MQDEILSNPRKLTEADLEAIRGRRLIAWDELTRISAGDRRWTMSIPAQQGDSDERFGNALEDSRRLEQEVYRLRVEVKKLLVEGEWPAEASAIREALKAILFDPLPTPVARRHPLTVSPEANARLIAEGLTEEDFTTAPQPRVINGRCGCTLLPALFDEDGLPVPAASR